jgi:multidrug efflux system membrane fusion protein
MVPFLNTRTSPVQPVFRWLAVLVLVLPLLFACGKPQKNNRPQRPPVPVEIGDVVQADSPVFLDGIGNVEAFNVVQIKSRVTGELIRTFFREGDMLTEGQDLFTIDPAPFQASLQEVEAKLSQAQTQYEQARREYRRFQGLYEEKAVSLEQLETKEVDMKSKHAQVELNMAERANAKLNLGYCYIKAPMTGKSGKILVDDFNIVNANQDVLVTIRQIQPVKVSFSLPGKLLDEIRAYHAKGPLELRVFTLESDKPEIGTLHLIDNTINPRTGMIRLEGILANENLRLWPGQFLKVALKLTTTFNATLVPQTALNDGPDGKYAWVVKEDQTVEIRPVKVTRRDGIMDVVAEGLKPGERVITDGQLMLRPGAKVVTRAQLREMMKKAAPGPHGPGEKAAPTKDKKPEAQHKP